MKWLLLILLLGASCAKAPASRTARTVACDPASMTIEDGALPVAGGPDSSDAVGTGALTLTRDGTCRHVALGLQAAGGTPAKTGVLAGSFQRAYGLVRVPLPRALVAIARADSAFDDSVLAAAYVVHGLHGGYFLDVHLAAPAKASARAAATPGVVAVDLAPGGGAIPAPAPHARNVVVLEPRNGVAQYPLVIRGYARTFEANVQAWIATAGGVSVATKTHTTAADWMTTWGEFEITIPSGPGGDVTLFVGEESAKDGTPIGVTIPLRMP